MLQTDKILVSLQHSKMFLTFYCIVETIEEGIMNYTYKDTILEYRVLGEGIPILFLHGWGMDYRIMKGCFEKTFEHLETKYKRIYVDLPGMGKSVAGDSIQTSDDVLEVLYEFSKDIIGEPFILAGESYGGYLARGFVHHYEEHVKGLILLCPLVYPGQGAENSLNVIMRDTDFLKTLTKEEYDYFTYMNVILTKPVWEQFEKDILPAIKEQNRHFLDHVLDGAFSFDVNELLKPYRKPCLIIVGKQDTQVGYKDQFELLSQFPNATYCAINGAGHNMQIEQPEFFDQIVTCWLRSNVLELELS